MADFKTDTNNKILQDAVKSLRLRFPVAEIERATGFKKGAISGYLNNKVPVSDTFLKAFADAFKVDLREFGYTNGMERVETKNPPQEETGSYTLLREVIHNQAKQIEFLQELLLKK